MSKKTRSKTTAIAQKRRERIKHRLKLAEERKQYAEYRKHAEKVAALLK